MTAGVGGGWGGLFECWQELFHLEQEKIKADQNNSRLVSREREREKERARARDRVSAVF
jgi:hypothetical protein